MLMLHHLCSFVRALADVAISVGLRTDMHTWVCFFPSTCLNPILVSLRYFILREDLLEQYAKGENPVSPSF